MYMVTLTLEEKLILISTCSAILAFVVVLTICFVCPRCCIYRKLAKRERFLGENNPHWYIQNSFELNYLDLDAPPPYEATRRTSVTQLANGSDYSRRLVSLPSTATPTYYSGSHTFAGIPLPSLNDVNIPYHPEEDEANKGSVVISIQFKRIQTSGNVYTQLRVDLKEANDLHMRMRGGMPNPYFIIALYDTTAFKKSQRNKKAIPRFEFISAVVRKTQNPVYHENFFFPMENRQLRKCVLKLEAWDQDKLTNDTCLGTANYFLKDAEKLLLEEITKEIDLTLKLEEAKFNYGKILLGLCYLPTSERLTVAVLKADNLMRVKTIDLERAEEGFFIEGLIILNGKIKEDRRTNILPADKLPFVNEMIMFDVPASKFSQICLVIAVYSTLDNDKGFQAVRQSHGDNDTCIGKCVIGANGRKKAAQQWSNIQNQPRRQIIEWHDLK